MIIEPVIESCTVKIFFVTVLLCACFWIMVFYHARTIKKMNKTISYLKEQNKFKTEQIIDYYSEMKRLEFIIRDMCDVKSVHDPIPYVDYDPRAKKLKEERDKVSNPT